MGTVNSYKELVELINIHERLLKTYKNNLRLINSFLLKLGYPSGYGGSRSYVDADCIHGGKPEAHEDKWNEAVKLKDLIEIEEELLLGYKTAKENIDSKLNGLNGIEYKIAYLKYVEGLDLQQISSKLGYSYGYIRNIFKNVTKM